MFAGAKDVAKIEVALHKLGEAEDANRNAAAQLKRAWDRNGEDKQMTDQEMMNAERMIYAFEATANAIKAARELM